MLIRVGRPVHWPKISYDGRGNIPFGYIPSDDPEILVPDLEERYVIRGEPLNILEVRDLAVRLYKSGRYKQTEIAKWFSTVVGKTYRPDVLFHHRGEKTTKGRFIPRSFGLLTDDWRKRILKRSMDEPRFAEIDEALAERRAEEEDDEG